MTGHYLQPPWGHAPGTGDIAAGSTCCLQRWELMGGGWLPSAGQRRQFAGGWGSAYTYLGRLDGLEVSSSHKGAASSAPLPPLQKWAKTPPASCWWPPCCTWPGRAISRPPALQRSHLLDLLETGRTKKTVSWSRYFKDRTENGWWQRSEHHFFYDILLDKEEANWDKPSRPIPLWCNISVVV